MPNKIGNNQQKILFVINPISGDIDKNHLKDRIQFFAAKQNFSYRIFYTTGENDPALIKEIISEFKPTKVISVGGDGTCNLVGKILLNSTIQMGIIPLGSANGLAKELMIPQTLDEALQIVVDGTPKTIDVLKVNEDYISLHLSDIGVNAKVVARFEKDNVRGFWGYAKHFIKELQVAKPLKFKLIMENQCLYKKAYMVVLANASNYGTGASINPEGKLDDGQFEVVLIRPYSFWQTIKMVIPFFTRKLHLLDYVSIYNCKKVKIINHKKQIVQVDGEVIGRLEEVNVEIIPQSLQVLAP